MNDLDFDEFKLKGVVPVFDTLTNKNTRIHKDIFYANRDRYIALSSKKMRNLNRN